MNKVALGTILGTALLGLSKSKSGGRSVKPKFIQNRSYFKGLDSEWVSNSGPPQEAIPELIVFSTLIPREPDINVYGAGEFNKEIKKIPNAESIFVEEIRNKGEPDFRKAKNLKHLAIRGTFKELRPERFRGLNKLESLAISSENMTVIPDFLKDIPNLKMLCIAAPIYNLSPLKGMTQLSFLKIEAFLVLQDESPRIHLANESTFKTLRTLTSLEYLFLSDFQVVFNYLSQFEVFQNMKNLKQLYVHQTSGLYMHSTDSIGYNYLSSCKKLEFLCLFNTAFHAHKGISLTEELGRLPKLKYLLLPYDRGGWHNYEYMTISDKNFPKLEYLWISGLENITFEGKFKSLETLFFKPYPNVEYSHHEGCQLRQAHGLQNLSALKNVFVKGSSYENYVVNMLNQLFSIRSIENISLYSKPSFSNMDLYNSKISCTKLKSLTLVLNDGNIAIPKDIKKCKNLESITIEGNKKTAVNKSLFDLPNLKSFKGNHLVLYNPRVDSIDECTKIPVELMYDSKASFSGEQKYIDISSLNPEFVYKIFSENKLSFNAKWGYGQVSFNGMSISSERSDIHFYIQKNIPFTFVFSEGDAETIPQLPISFDHQSIKELSEKKVTERGKEGKIPLGLTFNYPTPIVTKIIQPKYLSQPTTSLQQWKQASLPEQQYFSRGFDKKYKENPLYVPYRALSFNIATSRDNLGIALRKAKYAFNPDLYVKPFSEDITSLHIGEILPFKNIGSISFPNLHVFTFTSGMDIDTTPMDVFNFLEEIFNAAPNLTCIHIESEKLKVLPDNIGSLKNLSRLRIINSGISDLPASMKMNKRLYSLNLSNNQIRSFPMVFSDLQFSVTIFTIRGNLLDRNENLGQLYFTMRNKVKKALQNRNLTAFERDHYDNLRYTHKNIILENVMSKIRYPNYSEVNRIRKR